MLAAHFCRRRLLLNHKRTPISLQRRNLVEFITAYPNEVVLGAALSLAVYKIWELDLKTRAQASTMKTKEKAYTDKEEEWRASISNLQDKNYEIRDEKKHLEASIIDRGKRGEEILRKLLVECQENNIIKGFTLQAEISPGKRPDAMVEIMEGANVVVDSKNPAPPTNIDSDESRKEYVHTLKMHTRELSGKRYSAYIQQQSNPATTITLMILPGEGYLQAAYDDAGRDVFGLHEFARERDVLIVGPNGLRTFLQALRLWLEEQAANERLNEDEEVHTNIIKTLGPLWVSSILPFMKQTGSTLEKVVKTWNAKVERIIEFDAALRDEKVLNLPKARKTQLPKRVTEPIQVSLKTDE